MYPDIPFEGLSWPVTQHSGIISEAVIKGLIEACIDLNGKAIDADAINRHIVARGIVTDNIRTDSSRVDAWRDYQQILSEFGLIYSTRVSDRLLLTPIAVAFADGEISYSELITLQALRYQYPNGHKTQISPSLRDSYEADGNNFSFSSFAEMQASMGMLLRPVVAVWQILYSLHQKGEKPLLTIDELQAYVVRCLRHSDVQFCVDAIIKSRHTDYSLPRLPRARRNMQDWIKILSQTPLFCSDDDRNSFVALSSYSTEQAEAISAICHHLSKPETFWIYTASDNFKLDWFDFYGGIDIATDWVPLTDDGHPTEPADVKSSQDDDDVLAADSRDIHLRRFEPMYVSGGSPHRKVVSVYDYKKSATGHRLHDSMVNLIASQCVAKGAEVSYDPRTVDLYIKYKSADFIVEVKSTTPSNFVARLRSAIGQVKQYDYLMHRATQGSSRLGLAFTANIPENDWSVPFITDYMDMDLLCMNANSLSVRSNDKLSLELYG